MKHFGKALMLAATLAPALPSAPAWAQWGPNVLAEAVADERLEAAAWNLGLLRELNLNFNRVNLIEYTGHGTMVDVEAGETEPFTVDRYTYTVSFAYPAARLDFVKNGERVIRVFNQDWAWNEGPQPGLNPTYVDDTLLPLRRGMVWLYPLAFTRAAAFAKVGRCPDGSECAVPVSITDIAGGKTQIEVTIDGKAFTGILTPDFLYETITGTITMPDGQEREMTAHYSSFRDGTIGLNLESPLDKFYSGVYFPEAFTITSGDQTILELTLEEGWSNPYAIFPGPGDRL